MNYYFELFLRYQQFCGNEKPNAIISRSNTMLIKFNSNCCNTGKGFKATFKEHDMPEPAPKRLPTLTPDSCRELFCH